MDKYSADSWAPGVPNPAGIEPQVVRLQARAKLNLYLAVGARRGDGYHGIDSVVVPITLADVLTVKVSLDRSLTASGFVVPTDPTNLVWQACRQLEQLVGPLDPDIAGLCWSVELEKRIPVGAGLGGGSSDAAAMIMALSRFGATPLARAHLNAAAAAVGSDVPFFLQGGVCHVTGRGEVIQPLDWPGDWNVVVAVPSEQIATAEAYSWLDAAGPRQPQSSEALRAALARGSLDGIAGELWNDFEPVVFQHLPITQHLKRRLLDLGALGALLCGSGSGVFGLFLDSRCAKAAAGVLAQEGHWAITALTTRQAIVQISTRN